MGKKARQTAASKAPQQEGGWKGKLISWAEKFEALVNAAAASVPCARLKMWIDGFFHPEEEYDKSQAKATPPELFYNLLFFYFFYSLAFFLFMIALTSVLPPEDMQAVGFNPSPDIAQIAIGSLVVGPVISTITALAAFLLVYLPARALGGSGGYMQQSYAMSRVLCGSNVLLMVLMLAAFLVFMPSFLAQDSLLLGTVLSIIGALVNIPVFLLCLAILLYTIYAYYLVVRKAHGFSSWRAAGAMVVAAVFVVLADAAVGWLLRTV